MKKIQDFIENKSFQRIILVFCFIFSAICLLLVISQIYSFSHQQKQLPTNPPLNQNNSNSPPPQIPPARDDFFSGIPKGSPIMLLIFLFGFIISLLAGIIIYDYLGKKEKKIIRNELVKTKKEVKSKIINELLLPEEKTILDLLKGNNGSLTQSELVRKSGLNKLKISRIVKKLESLSILEKHPYGMTNKIKLKSKF